ncbi:MAG: hypothetical protein HOL89_17105 [Alphaproteobacteria bacterium]|nr:hypothetical protein [Alphaproteobacteria bacterium]
MTLDIRIILSFCNGVMSGEAKIVSTLYLFNSIMFQGLPVTTSGWRNADRRH